MAAPRHWLVLAFVPSSLMLGATTYITRDIAPVRCSGAAADGLPQTFVVAFAPRDPSPLIRAARLALPLLAVILVHVVVAGAQRPLWLLTLLHVVVLFAELVCHGRLAAGRLRLTA